MTHHFLHPAKIGRRYRLTKRSAAPGASWYLTFEDRGERIIKSTGYPDTAGAVRWARDYLDARRDDNAAALSALLQRPGTVECSTLGDVLTWYEVHAHHVSPTTRAGYLNCLRLVIRTATAETAIEKLPASVLNKDLVIGWQNAKQGEANAAADQETASRIKRSANSILNQAKSVFSLLTVENMRRAGLRLPDLEPFLTAAKTFRFAKCSKDDYRPPTDAVIAATLAAWRAVKGTDPNLYRAIWLALSCGLRAAEISQARWEWITVQDGAPLLLATGGQFKDGTGTLRVRPIDPFWSEGLAGCTGNGAWQFEAGPILGGTDTETRTDVFRRVSILMRTAGWRTQKAAHALRALSGSWVAAKWGIYTAQQWLRHSSVMVTETHYSVLLKDNTFKPLPVEWGGQSTADEPRLTQMNTTNQERIKL